MENVKLSDLTFRDWKYSEAPTPWERVKIANQVAFDAANDPNMRKLAGQILKKNRNVPRTGAQAIADWIRRNFTYLQEAPGVELLQGPYTTLYAKVVDCDDAAILHTALARAAGLRTFFVGVGEKRNPKNLVHAVVYDQGTDQMFEVIDDSAYGSPKPGIKFRLPRGYYAVYHSNEPGSEGYYASMQGSRFRRIEENNMTCKGCDTMYGSLLTTMGGTGDKPSPGGSSAPTAGGQHEEQGSNIYDFLSAAATGLTSIWAGPSETHEHEHYEGEGWTTEGYDEYEAPTFPWKITLAAVAGGGVLIYLLTRKD